MRYVVFMFTDPDDAKALTQSELSEIAAKHEKLRNELHESGELLNGCGLELAEDTTTFRLVDDAPVGERRPVSPSREHATAYYVLEVDDGERAVEIAGRLLDFHVTAVEVRLVHDSTGLPPERH